MRWIAVLLSPWGRIGRLAFWLVMVAATMLVVLSFVGLVVFMIETKARDLDEGQDLVIGGVAIVVVCAALYLSTVACAKRFNDRGKSIWWLFLGFVPVLGPFWLLIELGFLRGTIRHNRYGPSPSGHGADIGAIFDDQPFTSIAPKGRISNLLAVLVGSMGSIVVFATVVFMLLQQKPS